MYVNVLVLYLVKKLKNQVIRFSSCSTTDVVVNCIKSLALAYSVGHAVGCRSCGHIWAPR